MQPYYFNKCYHLEISLVIFNSIYNLLNNFTTYNDNNQNYLKLCNEKEINLRFLQKYLKLYHTLIIILNQKNFLFINQYNQNIILILHYVLCLRN